jgi:hypothetical protein
MRQIVIYISLKIWYINFSLAYKSKLINNYIFVSQVFYILNKFELFLVVFNKIMEKKVKGFLVKNKENADFNQYWYSDKTILFLANQAQQSESCCFLSTPSIFYGLENPNFEKPYYVFDLD